MAGRAGLGGFVLDLMFAGLFLMALNPLLGAALLQPTLSGLLLGMVANEAVIVSSPVPVVKKTLFSFISSLGIREIIAFLFTLWLDICITVSNAPS